MASSSSLDPKWKKSLRGIRGGFKDIRGHFTHVTIDEQQPPIGRGSPENLDRNLESPGAASRAKKCPSRQWMRKRKSTDSPVATIVPQTPILVEPVPMTPPLAVVEPARLTLSVPERRFASEFEDGMVDRTLLVSNCCVTTNTIPMSVAVNLAPKMQQDPHRAIAEQDANAANALELDTAESMSDGSNDSLEASLQTSFKLCHWFRDIPPAPRLSNGYPIHDIWPLGDDIRKAVDIIEGLPSRSYVWPDEARWYIRIGHTQTSRVYGPYSGTDLDAAHMQARLDLWWGYRRAGEQADYTDLGQWKSFCGGAYRPFLCPYYGYKVDTKTLEPLTTLPEPAAVSDNLCCSEPVSWNVCLDADWSYNLDLPRKQSSEQKRQLTDRLLTLIEELDNESEFEKRSTYPRNHGGRDSIARLNCKVVHYGHGKSRIEVNYILDADERIDYEGDCSLVEDVPSCREHAQKFEEDHADIQAIEGRSTKDDLEEMKSSNVPSSLECMKRSQSQELQPQADSSTVGMRACKEMAYARSSEESSTVSDIMDRDWTKVNHDSNSLDAVQHFPQARIVEDGKVEYADDSTSSHGVPDFYDAVALPPDVAAPEVTGNLGEKAKFEHFEHCSDDIPAIAAGAARFSKSIMQNPFACDSFDLRGRGLATSPQPTFIRQELYTDANLPINTTNLNKPWLSNPIQNEVEKCGIDVARCDSQLRVPKRTDAKDKPCDDGAEPTLVQRMVRKFSSQSSTDSIYTDDVSTIPISEGSATSARDSKSRSSSTTVPLLAGDE